MTLQHSLQSLWHLRVVLSRFWMKHGLDLLDQPAAILLQLDELGSKLHILLLQRRGAHDLVTERLVELLLLPKLTDKLIVHLPHAGLQRVHLLLQRIALLLESAHLVEEHEAEALQVLHLLPQLVEAFVLHLQAPLPLLELGSNLVHHLLRCLKLLAQLLLLLRSLNEFGILGLHLILEHSNRLLHAHSILQGRGGFLGLVLQCFALSLEDLDDLVFVFRLLLAQRFLELEAIGFQEVANLVVLHPPLS
mmetsp:Transcript_30960/g.72618  ORF Transcript_30960/g.72618 Transcript_30960/m.72618 type:complete len:249 (-) Transcript_30960:2948-3694(-)